MVTCVEPWLMVSPMPPIKIVLLSQISCCRSVCLGLSNDGMTGTVVLSCLHISSSGGLWPLKRGVSREAICARLGSSSFCRSFFTVRTACSTSLLLCGNLGLDIICWNVHFFKNWPKRSDENWGPLSDLTAEGTLCLAKIDLRFSRTAADVLFLCFIFPISGKITNN